MSKTAKHVWLLAGGRSGEHRISLLSAKNILPVLEANYTVTVIGIDTDGAWYHLKNEPFLYTDDAKKVCLNKTNKQIFLNPTPAQAAFFLKDGTELENPDVIFPALHGTFGEDGTLQGLFDLAEIAYVGAGTLASAICMDKIITKKLLRDAGIDIVPFLVVDENDDLPNYSAVSEKLGANLFVKPVNLGSSVGIHKVHDEKTLAAAVQDARQYDRRVLIERAIEGRELEIAVLGTKPLTLSSVGEIIPSHEFYSYEAKYLDPDGAALHIPADITQAQSQEIKNIAEIAFEALQLSGLSRIDFFLENESSKIFLNEVNTMPGFTKISMYPKLMEHAGLGYAQLLDALIDIGIERHEKQIQLKRVY